MSSERLMLHAAIVLVACVAGFVMGRWPARQATAPPPPTILSPAFTNDPNGGQPFGLDLGLDFDLDLDVGPAAFPGEESSEGPTREFYPEAAETPSGESAPGRLIPPDSASPLPADLPVKKRGPATSAGAAENRRLGLRHPPPGPVPLGPGADRRHAGPATLPAVTPGP